VIQPQHDSILISICSFVVHSTGSVQFYFDDVPGLCEENSPYALFGDDNPNGPNLSDFGSFNNAFVNPGIHEIVAVPFASSGCTGDFGCPLKKVFKVTCTAAPSIGAGEGEKVTDLGEGIAGLV
jgi:hypothetical protein